MEFTAFRHLQSKLISKAQGTACLWCLYTQELPHHSNCATSLPSLLGRLCVLFTLSILTVASTEVSIQVHFELC